MAKKEFVLELKNLKAGKAITNRIFNAMVRAGVIDSFGREKRKVEGKRSKPPIKKRKGPKFKTGNTFLAGNVEVVLTPNQEKVLRPDVLLGCGTFGCAYSIKKDLDHIVKLTRDDTDAAASQKFKDLRVVKTKEVHDLGHGLFAIVNEKLTNLDRLRSGWLEMPINTDAERKLLTTAKADDSVRNHMKDVCPTTDFAVRKACRGFMDELADLHNRGAAKGLALGDFHPSNFGLDKNGNWKLLDLGISGVRPKGIKKLNGM